MKNYYDKVLLILTLVLLGFGVIAFFTTGGLPKSGPPPHLQDNPKGGAYQSLDAPAVPDDKITWPEAEDQTPKGEQAKGRVYDVFTPPKIWYDPQNKSWLWEPPQITVNKPAFGLVLDGLKDKLYRIQLKGFAGESTDPNKLLVEFEDTTTGENFDARKGQDVTAYNMKLVDFSTEIITPEPDKGDEDELSVKELVDKAGGNSTLVEAASENSLRERIYKAQIHDDVLNKDIELTSGKPAVEQGAHYMLLETVPPVPAKEWQVEKVGDALDLDDIHYEVKDINFDVAKPSVTVEKRYIYTDPRTNISIPTTDGPTVLTPEAPSNTSNTPSAASPASTPSTPSSDSGTSTPTPTPSSPNP